MVARHCGIAGIALVGSGVIAATPVAPLPPEVQAPVVALTASIDPVGPWVDVFTTAWQNATQVSGAIEDAAAAIVGNVESKIATATFIGVDVASDEGAALAARTLDFNHLWGLQYLAGADMGMGIEPIPAVEPAATLLTLLSSPLSGVLMGLIGPFASPGVALLNSIGDVVQGLGGGDLSAVAQDLLAIPANVVGGFLNGATLDLGVLLPLLEQLLQVPDGNEIIGASWDFGGLLTPGITEAGNVGGSAFNSLGLDLIMVGMPMPYLAPGEGIGLVGALANLTELVAGAFS